MAKWRQHSEKAEFAEDASPLPVGAFACFLRVRQGVSWNWGVNSGHDPTVHHPNPCPSPHSHLFLENSTRRTPPRLRAARFCNNLNFGDGICGEFDLQEASQRRNGKLLFKSRLLVCAALILRIRPTRSLLNTNQTYKDSWRKWTETHISVKKKLYNIGFSKAQQLRNNRTINSLQVSRNLEEGNAKQHFAMSVPTSDFPTNPRNLQCFVKDQEIYMISTPLCK